MALSDRMPPTSGSTPTVRDATTGVHIVPEPPSVLSVIVADMFQPTVGTPSPQRDEVRDRLLGMLCYLLTARRILVLHREQPDTPRPGDQTYEVWLVDQAGSLHRSGQTVPAQSPPLPLVRAQATGVLIAHPQENRQVAPPVAELLDSTPALLLALPSTRRNNADDVLVLSLDAMPRDGEVALALALVRRAATMRPRALDVGRVLTWGGRAACRRADDRHAATGSPGLSPREREVVQQVAAGLRNKEIARRLNISEKTVTFHLGRIFDKLGVDSRTEVLLHAISTGLVSPGELPGAPREPEAPSS